MRAIQLSSIHDNSIFAWYLHAKARGNHTFQEICKCIPDAFISSGSLKTVRNRNLLEKEFELMLYASLTAKDLDAIKSIVSRHRMFLREDKGSLEINEVEQPIEIQVVV